MCWQCNASPHAGELCWTQGDLTARWRQTLRSHEMYLAKLQDRGAPLPPIFLIRALRLEGCLGDWMHTSDQGVASHIVGNCLHEIMRLAHWGATQFEQARGLGDELKAWYKSTKEKYRIDGKVTFARVKKPGEWPRFLAKAAATFIAKLVHWPNGVNQFCNIYMC